MDKEKQITLWLFKYTGNFSCMYMVEQECFSSDILHCNCVKQNMYNFINPLKAADFISSHSCLVFKTFY